MLLLRHRDAFVGRSVGRKTASPENTYQATTNGGPPLMRMITTNTLWHYDKVTLDRQPRVDVRSILRNPETERATFAAIWPKAELLVPTP